MEKIKKKTKHGFLHAVERDADNVYQKGRGMVSSIESEGGRILREAEEDGRGWMRGVERDAGNLYRDGRGVINRAEGEAGRLYRDGRGLMHRAERWAKDGIHSAEREIGNAMETNSKYQNQRDEELQNSKY